MARAIPVEVKSGEETRLRDTTLTVSRPGVVRLRVTNDTGNSSEAQVVLEVSEGRQTRVVSDLFDVAESWKELRKEYFPSIPGTYTATAASTVAGVSGATTFEFTGGDVDVTVSLTAGTGKLTGKIMLLSQGSEPKPASDVHVLLNLDPGPPGWSFPVNATDGTFDLTDLPFGRYELRLTNLPADSYLSSVRQGERDALNNGVLIQQDQTHVDVTLSSGLATVQGKVTNSENRVVHGAMVVLMPETPGRTVGYRTDRTDQNGAYQLRNLVPGTYRLYAFIARNDDSFAEPSFLRQFEDKGKPVTVERRSQLSLDLKGIE
jgi:hypothetical protein